jgi:hypothetical protein
LRPRSASGIGMITRITATPRKSRLAATIRIVRTESRGRNNPHRRTTMKIVLRAVS